VDELQDSQPQLVRVVSNVPVEPTHDQDLIRAALPSFLLGAAATLENKLGIEQEHCPGCMDGILEHYAPFMLD
jgi:hypothetical protein